jgi:hypothetical protein
MGSYRSILSNSLRLVDKLYVVAVWVTDDDGLENVQYRVGLA